MLTTDPTMKPSMTPVTILMPVSNAGHRITDAIESILSQTHSCFELLIIDDGSADKSIDIIRAYGDPRIRLIVHEQPQGLAVTLNEGIRASAHELIARMDAEDISHPWRLEKQVALMQAYPDCALAGTWVKRMDKHKNYLRTEGCPDAHLYYNLAFSCCIRHSTVIYRKRIVEQSGGYRSDDPDAYDLFWRISRNHPIHILEEPLQSCLTGTVPSNTGSETGAALGILPHKLDAFIKNGERISEPFIYCFQHNYWPDPRNINLDQVYRCLDLLEKISLRILTVENPNRDGMVMQQLREDKRQYIIRNLAAQTTLSKAWKLLFHEHQTAYAMKIMMKRVARSLNKNSTN